MEALTAVESWLFPSTRQDERREWTGRPIGCLRGRSKPRLGLKYARIAQSGQEKPHAVVIFTHSGWFVAFF